MFLALCCFRLCVPQYHIHNSVVLQYLDKMMVVFVCFSHYVCSSRLIDVFERWFAIMIMILRYYSVTTAEMDPYFNLAKILQQFLSFILIALVCPFVRKKNHICDSCIWWDNKVCSLTCWTCAKRASSAREYVRLMQVYLCSGAQKNFAPFVSLGLPKLSLLDLMDLNHMLHQPHLHTLPFFEKIFDRPCVIAQNRAAWKLLLLEC